ncbi:hypothetical protein IKS38_02195 [bacterium]|nr:hypothetical protein [bacterium]
MRIVVFILLLSFSFFSFGEENDYIFRFSSRNVNEHFTVGNNLLNFRQCSGSSDWVSVSFNENHQSIDFRAKQPTTIENLSSAMFTVKYDGSNVFEHVVMEPKTYRFLCQWDDEGIIEQDKNYSASLLNVKDGFISLGLEDGDSDKWVFTPQKQGLCLEVTATNDFVLEARQGSIDFGEPENVIFSRNKNLFSKRLYVTNAILGRPLDFIVSRPENAAAETISYKFSLRPARPLVLIHGIRSEPTWHGSKETSFGDLKEKACRYEPFPPCLAFDFPWNSNQGSIKDYCGGKGSEFTLYGFTDKRCGDWELKPLFFTHSMGGLLLVEQMKNSEFSEAVAGAVFAGSPFCGSDIANVLLQSDIGRKAKAGADLINKVKTTTENFKLLARGSKSISERLKAVKTNFPVLFLVGGRLDNRITGRGDERVNISSSALFNTLSFSDEDHVITGMEHGELVDITLPPGSGHRVFCNKLQEMMEH